MTKFYLSLSRYLTVLLVFVSTIAWSQGRTVTGKVTSADDGSGLPGVNVVEKGTSNGTVTDVNGAFSLNAGDNATLVFSFVGYATQEIAVAGQSSISVNLQADVTALSEVVVIGYGEVNKRDATGAVASVKAESFNRGIIASPEQLIQGKVAGVQMTSSSGEPGAAVSLRIRGTTSLRAGNGPLYVVDGIPLSSEDVSAGGSDFGRGGGTAKNPMNFINPNDIESIDVLKDASATAIYGSRGANGVVLITTKSGKGKKKVLDYSTTVSVSKQARYYDVLSGPAFLSAYSKYGDPASVNFGANTDWQKQISRTAVSNNHNLAYSNSYKNGNYRAGFSYDNQEGVIKNSGMTRYTGRLNLNHSFYQDKLKFGLQGTISKVNDQAPPITNTPGFEGDLIGASLFYNPTIPATPTNLNALTADPADQYPGDAANPLSMLKFYKDKTQTDRKLINLSLGYDITKELNFKINGGIDRSFSERLSAMSALQTKVGNVAGNGRAFLNDKTLANNLVEAFATYKKNMGNNSLNVVAGYSYQSFATKGINASAAGFGNITELDPMTDEIKYATQAVTSSIPTPWIQYEYERGNLLRVYDYYNSAPTEYPAAGGGLPIIGPRGVTGTKYSYKDELQSFFARVNYNIGEKFFFTASAREDGSTKFAQDKKYGFFPSAAAKWRLSEEDFIPEIFDDLSLRLGYGVTGNQSFNHNVYTGRYQWAGVGLQNTGQINSAVGQNPVSFGNKKLQWESTSAVNLGIDFGFFNSRLSGTLDVYSKNTTKLLMQVIAAQPAPTQFVWRNLDANVINSGVELTLNGVVVDQTDFGVNVGFNIAYNKNMVKNYDGSPLPTGNINGQGLTGAYAQRIANNQPLFSYYVRNWGGFDEAGLNAGSDVQQFLGKSALPKINTGLNISVRAYNFDLAAYAYGQFGQYVYNNVSNAFFTKGALGAGRNVTSDVVGSTESVGNSPDVSTRFLEKGDFIRMQNLSLGYNFKLGGQSFIKKLRLSATGQNLFLITSYSGRDPEVNVDKNLNNVPSLGIDYTSYPRARTFTFGLNATF
jgi:TonB-linked SusC/RagA family outer membrane protein